MRMRSVAEPSRFEPWPEIESGRASGLTPRQAVVFLRKRGWLIAAVTLLCLLGGLFFQLTSPPRYVSTTQVIVDPRELQTVTPDASPRNDNSDTTEASVENEMRVLKSNTVLSALIDKEDLTHDPEFVGQPSLLSTVLHRFLGAKPNAASEADALRTTKLRILQELDRLVAVRRTERSFVIDVTVTTSDPDKSARLANDLVQIYIDHAIATRAALNRRAGEALQGRLSDLQARVRDADERVERFRVEHRLISAGGVLTSDQSLRDLNNQLALARIQEDQDRAKLDQIQRLSSANGIASSPEAVDSPAVMQLRTQIAEAMSRRSALARKLGPRHPDYIAANDQVQTLQHVLQQELQRVAAAAENRYGRAKENEQNLQQSVAALSQSALENSQAGARLRELEQEAEAARTLFNSFLSRSNQLIEQTQLYTSNVRQISMALPSLQRANIPLAVTLLLALMAGLVLGTGLALALEVRDHLLGEDEPNRTWRGV